MVLYLLPVNLGTLLMLSTIPNFLSQVKDELKRVIWPKRQEVIQLTTQVITLSILCAIFIGVFDYLFTEITNLAL